MSLAVILASEGVALGDAFRLYVGTYTGKTGAKGIYTCLLDLSHGTISEPVLAAECENASWLAWNHDHTRLYAASERGGHDLGAVLTYAVDPHNGGLQCLGQAPTGGSAPCHLSLADRDRLLLLAHYGSGNVSALALDAQGLPSSAPQRFPHLSTGAPRQAHAHAIVPAPDGRFALAADLGLDEILTYRVGTGTGLLERAETPPCVLEAGAGPRHLVFHPLLPCLYVVNELNNTVTRLEYDRQTGQCQPRQTVATLPEGFAGKSDTSEIQIDTEGRTLYVANRGHDSITAYAIDKKTGTLTWLQNQKCGGHWPRFFNIDPSGRWMIVANERSGSLTVLAVDRASGRLGAPQAPVAIPAPACVVFSENEKGSFIPHK